jgi:hypothetical protein
MCIHAVGTLLLDGGFSSLLGSIATRAEAAAEAAAMAASMVASAERALVGPAENRPSSERQSQLQEELENYQMEQKRHEQEQQQLEALVASITASLCLLRALGGQPTCQSVSEAAGQVLTRSCPPEKMPDEGQDELLKALEGFWLNPGSVRVVAVMDVAQQLVGVLGRMTPLQVGWGGSGGCLGLRRGWEGKLAGRGYGGCGVD